ncbi:GNAT family N-acetyltransferase [Paenibacillus sp. D2_2]|uniref:GNAT family N-acetyltransferase n=1 Tax=Paenibacillus sp. D2_2 TaxID=3073092 RepID=UPI002814F4FA|nr:GNAT family N-acetyltransferase [Paenibacillus sp. D2_2]WMT40625.1 GNAT family N-acetyltransferase [Paenibacillus sp. D2_2]
MLDEAVQNDPSYKLMVEALECRFQRLGKKQADCLFFNPMMLSWIIPGTADHEHNNAPGVPEGSRLHDFLLCYGYVERAQECGMYMPLAEFEIPEEVRVKESKAEGDGYRVELFDLSKHRGLEEMLDGLDNPLWREQIPRYAEQGVPVMIAAYQGHVAGFAGPIIREPSGRAFFTGIGVHPQHEGHGLGSILFFEMCEAFRQIGRIICLYLQAAVIRPSAFMRKQVFRRSNGLPL